jgi:hypothetical protein
MRNRWRVRAIVCIVLMLGVVMGGALRWDATPESGRARYLSLRLLPLEEWGFGREAHAPVPISLPSKIATNSSPMNSGAGRRRFRVTIPGTKKESGPVSERNEVAVYVRVGAAPKARAGGTTQPTATLNNQFLQSQMQRQTRMLQMVQSRMSELQRILRQAATSLRPPQKRVIQMDMEMLQSQLTALQQAQMMTLQALTHTTYGSHYMRMTLAPTIIVSENFLQRMATDGETVRLGPVEVARAARVQIEPLN